MRVVEKREALWVRGKREIAIAGNYKTRQRQQLDSQTLAVLQDRVV